VLVFETECGKERCWNRFGGAEILSFENHHMPTILPRKDGFYVRGCNVLFNDGTVRFIKPEEVGKLKWKSD
jgi:hypothetical protein